MAKAKTVKMVRDDGKEAAVHPSMVEEYRKGGYREVKPKVTSK